MGGETRRRSTALAQFTRGWTKKTGSNTRDHHEVVLVRQLCALAGRKAIAA